MQTLNLGAGDRPPIVTEVVAGAPPPVARFNPAIAWILSLLLPGAGQLYLKKTTRAVVVFLFTLAAAVAASLTWGKTEMSLIAGIAMRLLVVLYLFAPLDAFYTAREINQGSDPWIHPNPRVAALLNLTTRGFGYFYCGERAKGIIVWLAVGVMNQALLSRQNSGLLQIAIEVILIFLAVDAYRIANRQVKEVLAVPSESYPIYSVSGGMSAALPLGVASFFVFNYFLLVSIGLISLHYKHLDQSRSTISTTATGQHKYENPEYGVAVTVPASWQPRRPTATESASPVLFVAEGQEGGCNIRVTVQALMPWITLESVGESIALNLETGNTNYHQLSAQPARLGSRPAHEVRMLAKFPNGFVQQHYVMARRGTTLFGVIGSMNTNLLPECEADLQEIEERFEIQ